MTCDLRLRRSRASAVGNQDQPGGMLRAARAVGVQPVTLGRRILRAETAAVVAAALVMQAMGELEYKE